MLKIAYLGGDTNPLAQVAYIGLVSEKKLGSLETETRDVAARAVSHQVEGSRSVAPLVIPNVARVAIVADSGGQPVVNVFGVRIEGGKALSAILQSVKDNWERVPSPLTQLAQQYAVRTYQITDLSTVDGAVADLPGTGIGRVQTHSATAGACYLVKMSGGTRSRSSNGRMYLGPMAEGCVQADGRTVEPGFRSGLEFEFNAFIDRLATDGNPMVVLSQKFLKATNVTGASVDTLIATQRRRIR